MTAVTQNSDTFHDVRGHTASIERIRDYRRIEVGRMLLARVPIRAMAARLNVSTTTVQRDIKVVERWWRDTAIKDHDTLVEREMTKLDELERAWLSHAMYDSEALDNVLRIMAQRAKYAGLNKPTQSELTVHQPLDEVRARALELVTSELERRRELEARAALASSNGEVIDV
jgi:hypothetical protein